MDPSYIPIQSERIYEQIVSQVEGQIVSGALKVGDKLPPERELAEQFQVSRSAVREAVKTLQKKGLVEVLPGRGTFVTNAISKATSESLELMMRMTTGIERGFSELFELRNTLEPDMAFLAAMRATAEDIGSMMKAVETMDASMNDMDAYIAADNLFHQALAKATHNTLFASLLEPIMGLLTEQRKSNFLAGVQSPQRAQHYHKKILNAITQHNPDKAKKAMRSHLEQVIIDIE